jgi:hypothetical protein
MASHSRGRSLIYCRKLSQISHNLRQIMLSRHVHELTEKKKKQRKSQKSLSPGQSLNQGCSEYKAEMLLTSTFGPNIFNLASDIRNLDDILTQIYKVFESNLLMSPLILT